MDNLIPKPLLTIDSRKPVISSLSGLGVLFGLFLIGLFITGIFSSVLFRSEISRISLLTQSSLQCVCAFILPSFAFSLTLGRNPFKFLDLEGNPGMMWPILIVLTLIVATPAMGQLIKYNEMLTFPESMLTLEKALRDMEKMAAETTSLILDTKSVGGLLVNTLVIGILTGFAEEIFFRGALQGLLIRSGINQHIAIWTAAVIFSAIHFQFFGFFPRLLLGAFFGYILIWSHSIWASSFAHAFNNSVVVVCTWLSAKGIIPYEIDQFGVVSNGIPWIAIISAAATGLIIFQIIIRERKSSALSNRLQKQGDR